MTLTPRYEQQYYEGVLQHLNMPFYLRYSHETHSTFMNNELMRLIRNIDAQPIQFEPLSPEAFVNLEAFLALLPSETPLVEVPLHMTPAHYFLLNESPLFSPEGQLIGFVGSVKSMSKEDSASLALVNRLSFERALSQISAALVSSQRDFDLTLDQCLEILSKSSGASRAYIFLYRDANQYMDNTHEWCAPGVTAEKSNLQNLETANLGWWMQKMNAREVIYIKSLSELPASESYLISVLEAQHITSLISFPLEIDGNLIGHVGLDNVNTFDIWHSEDFALLKFTATLFSSAIERKQYMDALSLNNRDLSNTLSELRLLQSQMIQQEKMVGIGQLAAGIAHEINNPLGYVASNLETLTKYVSRLEHAIRTSHEMIKELKENASPAEINEFKSRTHSLFRENKIEYVLSDLHDLIEDSKNGFERVSNIIVSLRNFARTDANARHEVYNLHQIIEEVLQILGNEIKYAATISKNVDPYVNFRCNRTEIGQVILNLVLNGVQAIKASSQLTTGTIGIKVFQSEPYIIIEISDNGIGMTEETQSHIFDPFFTTKEIGAGTGLGLSIAYDIVVNKHSGKISVDSQLGKGTTFVLKFKSN